MDGNRRYAKLHNLPNQKGHGAGCKSLIKLLKYSSEIGINYVTCYAFSIDNFNRPIDEVEALMNLFQEKFESVLNPKCDIHKYGFKIRFIGNMNLLSECLRIAIENAIKATAENNRGVLSICIAYTSTEEVFRAIGDSVKSVANGENDGVSLDEIEKRMYMEGAPDPDLLIRSSGQMRLSNFLLWQTSNSLLHVTAAFWPEFDSGHLFWALLKYQRSCSYLQKKSKRV